ncbi:GntR family transcriptional regulator [Pseudoroseomonas globiformis]|uniref:GntR family transcriptional regulator n=1 Tax=Teichococcus globiformis TaxID=2307229 RepID=A0ABV7G2S3_9PROT
MCYITLMQRNQGVVLDEAFSSIQRVETLADQARNALCAGLRQGLLAPGERITTRRVATMLNISLTPAREALNRLLAERVLDQGPNRTVAVPVLTRTRYAELCLIRLELEALAARHASPLISAADIDRLETLFDAHGHAFATKDSKRSLQLNEAFHFTIYAASGLSVLVEMLDALWLQVGPSMNLLFPAAFEGRWTGGRNHRVMLDALRARDAEALVAAVRKDLIEGRARLNTVLPAEAAH